MLFFRIATTSGIYPKILGIGAKIKLSKSSSYHFDDSVATVRLLRSDQSARYSIFLTVCSEKSGIAS